MIYTSRTVKSFNTDPEPMIDPFSGQRFPVADEMLGYLYYPRVEFDNTLHYESNPILVEFREIVERIGGENTASRLAEHWIKPDNWNEVCLKDDSLESFDEPTGTKEHEDHAYKVLSRIATIRK